MPAEKPNQTWDDDKPKVNPADDVFGFSGFAERLARSIYANNSDSGLVLGIYGKWGSGKSTLLNFIKWHLLNQKAKATDGNIIIMEFNPWLFSDSHRSLVYHFLHELLKILAPHKAIGKKLKTALARFLEAKLNSDDLTLVGEAITEFRPSLAKRGLQAILRKLSRTESLSDLKAKIHNGLALGNNRIVVFIDDIDRLESGEMRQIFQLVKAVADFPRITYVLGLDPQLVEESISQKDYLDKIVQCPFTLPVASRRRLDDLLEQRLLSIQGVTEDRIDKDRWYYIQSQGIHNIITSPRRLVRFTNAIGVSLSGVIDEVDICDFIGLELLRIFYPDIYETILHNKGLFTGIVSDNFFGLEYTSRDEAAVFHNAWITKCPDARFIKPLVETMFPNLKSAWDKSRTYGSDDRRWMTELRICSPNRFDTYFQFGVPEEELSQYALTRILSSLASKQFDADVILGLVNGKSKLDFLFNGIRVAAKETWKQEQQVYAIRHLFDLADELARASDKLVGGVLTLGIEDTVLYVLREILIALPTDQMEALMLTIVTETPSYGILGRLIQHLTDQRGQDQLRMSESVLKQLKSIFLGRISAMAKQGTLLDHPLADRLILLWGLWLPDEDLRGFVAKTLAMPSELMKYLRRLIHKGRYTSSEHVYSRDYEYLSLTGMPNEFMENLEKIAETIRKLDESEEDSQKLRELFEKSYEAVKAGVAPGHPDNVWRNRRDI